MRGRPPGEHPDHDDLIAAGQRCFLRSGFAEATMRQIAVEAGTSTSRLYVAFESKQALLVAVLSRGNRRLLEDYLRPVMLEPLPPWEQVMTLIEAYLRFFDEERELATLMATTVLNPSDPHPAMRELVANQQVQLDLFLSLAREITGTAGADVDASHVVRWCWSAIWGLTTLNVRLPHLAVDDDELDRIVGLGMRFVRSGLREAGKLAPAT